ncbi:MAG: hypothetical protein R2705_09505 [Ilumatobacteraceae bacterium]
MPTDLARRQCWRLADQELVRVGTRHETSGRAVVEVERSVSRYSAPAAPSSAYIGGWKKSSFMMRMS